LLFHVCPLGAAEYETHVHAGVSLSASSAALLALRLSRAGHSSLSERLGIAVDRGVGSFALLPGERRDILGVLDDAPEGCMSCATRSHTLHATVTDRAAEWNDSRRDTRRWDRWPRRRAER